MKRLEVSTADLVAVGGQKHVYRVSGAPDTLVKVVRPDRFHKMPPSKDKVFRRLGRRLLPSRRRFGPYWEWNRELEEFIASLARLHTLPTFVPRPLGFVETTNGIGYLVEHIRSADGTTAPNLRKYVAENGFDERLEVKVNDLFSDIDSYRFVISDVRASNLVYGRRVGDLDDRIFVVDGLYEATFIRLRTMCGAAFRRFNIRKRRRLLEELKKRGRYPN
ncbi:YrbL family protein [Alkalilacustris brevis]|uniref:YrbL family protein n=1 Tax=Alkalilacustris brevis TaxID=2026338 RepID=UPI000E0D66C3